MAAVKNNNLVVKSPSAPANASAQDPNQKPLKDLVADFEPQYAKMLPPGAQRFLTPTRFTRIALTAIQQNGIMNCTNRSVIGALMRAAQYGLEPASPTGEAYLIPRGDQCEFQIGYKGYMTLAYRSGKIKRFETNIVHENDHCVPHLGSRTELDFVPALKDPGEAIGCYAGYHTTDGEFVFTYMPMCEIVKHRQNTPAWSKHFDAMAKKTVVYELLKWCKLTPELSEAVGVDGTVQSVDPATGGSGEDITFTSTFIEEPPAPVSSEPMSQGYGNVVSFAPPDDDRPVTDPITGQVL